MADLLHADAIQQLEVALLGLPAVEVVDHLSGGLAQSRPVTVAASVEPHPPTYTSTPPAPPPVSVLVLEVSEFSPIPVVPTPESKSDEKIPTTPPKTKASDVFCTNFKTSLHYYHSNKSVSTMPSTSSISFPVVVVPKLAIPADAYPDHLNRPDGGKDYLCHFTHSNLDSILTHIRKYLDV